MTAIRLKGYRIIFFTFLVAFMLTIMPLPVRVDRLRPDWLCLVLIYWCMTTPRWVGVGTAWCWGLLEDAAKGALLGQHALALAIVAFLTLKVHRRIRVYPLWQQALSVLGLLFINQLLISWVNGVIGYPPRDLWYLAPAFAGMLLWPWMAVIMTDLHHRLQTP
jgi:rod shape-determining protein MreD